jgi:DNA-binding HxlR family transcriptional regulator
VTVHALTQIPAHECTRFTGAVELVGRRWNAGILLAVLRGATRFSEITATVTGLSDRMLAQRARELEAAGLLAREVIPSTPVQVRYRLTERGTELMRSLQPLVEWAHKWEPGVHGVVGGIRNEEALAG